jgi:hypothetical protein
LTLIKKKILLITKKFEKRVRKATTKLSLLKAEPKKRWHLLHDAKERLANEKVVLALTKKKWAKNLKEDKEENASIMRSEKNLIASGQKAKEIFKVCSKTKYKKWLKKWKKAKKRSSAFTRKLHKMELMDPKRKKIIRSRLKYVKMGVYY